MGTSKRNYGRGSQYDVQLEQWSRSGCDPQWAPDGDDDEGTIARRLRDGERRWDAWQENLRKAKIEKAKTEGGE